LSRDLIDADGRKPATADPEPAAAAFTFLWRQLNQLSRRDYSVNTVEKSVRKGDEGMDYIGVGGL